MFTDFVNLRYMTQPIKIFDHNLFQAVKVDVNQNADFL